MSVNLSIKGVPDDLANRLRRRAELNHRSLQGELMAIVEKAADESVEATQRTSRGDVIERAGSKTIAQIAAELRATRRKPAEDLPRSVDIIRRLRDGR